MFLIEDQHSSHGIAKKLEAQADFLGRLGEKLALEAEEMDGSKRINRLREATRTILSSAKVYAEAARIYERHEPPPIALQIARESLIKRAIDGGYDLAFDVDGKVILERLLPSGKTATAIEI